MIELVPAYGRTYVDIERALEDWEGGLDFKVQYGPYCSIRDLEQMVNAYDKVILLINSERKTLGSNIWGDIL